MSADMLIRFEQAAGNQLFEGKDIEVLSISGGLAKEASPTLSAAGAGTIEPSSRQNLIITRHRDQWTNALNESCSTGQKFGKATLRWYRGDGEGGREEILTITMQHVTIENFSVDREDREDITLNCGTIQYSYPHH